MPWSSAKGHSRRTWDGSSEARSVLTTEMSRFRVPTHGWAWAWEYSRKTRATLEAQQPCLNLVTFIMLHGQTSLQILKSFRAHSGSTVLHSARALRSARSRGLPAGFCRRRSHLRPRRTQFPHGSPSHSHRMPRSVGLCQGIWVGFALGKGALRTFVTANVTSLARQTGTARAHFHALLLLLDLLLL